MFLVFSKTSVWNFFILRRSCLYLTTQNIHNRQTFLRCVHAPGGIRTHRLIRWAVKDLRLGSRRHYDRPSYLYLMKTTHWENQSRWCLCGFLRSCAFQYSVGIRLFWARFFSTVCVGQYQGSSFQQATIFPLIIITGDRGSTVVKVLCYKSEGRWFDPS